MKFLKFTTEDIEQKEELLADKVRILDGEQKRKYYEQQVKRIKDPDTYASLNYCLILGLHHLYLGKLNTFLVETGILIIAILLAISEICVFGIIGMLAILTIVGYQLIQLFFSQRIVRYFNYEQSCAIYNEIIDLDIHKEDRA